MKDRKTCGKDCIGRIKSSVGERFERLTIVEELGRYDKNNTGNTQRYVRCTCDCGNDIEVLYNSLKTGNTESCGCYKSEIARNSMHKNRLDHTTHGLHDTKIYAIWRAMKQRCTNPNNEYFHRYGGRGIEVCNEWITFAPFNIWAINSGYEEGLSIDRVDNEGNYEPSNCVWLTMSEHSIKTAKDRTKSNRSKDRKSS